MKVALAQTEIYWEDKKRNFEKVKNLIIEARKQQAEIIFFPEMSLTGFSMNVNITSESMTGETVEKVREISRKEKIAVGIGWTKKGGNKAENHYTVIDYEKNIYSDYIKIHPFSYAGESEVFEGGNEISFFELGGYVWSTLICYDLRFPEVFQIACQDADVIVVPANWPEAREQHWKTLLRARAIENQSYILGVNCVGNIGGIKYNGGSVAFSPEGKCIAKLYGKEGIMYIDLQREKLNIRQTFPVRQDRKWMLYGEKYIKISESNN